MGLWKTEMQSLCWTFVYITVRMGGAVGLAVCVLEKSLNFNHGLEAVPELFKGIW